MDEYDYESDSYDEDAYDEELDAEPFFGNLLKSQTQIEEEEAKEREKEKARKVQEEQRKSQRIAERLSAQNDLDENNDDDFSDTVEDDYEEQDERVYDRKKSGKKERKCILCSKTDPKAKYFTLKGAKCRKDDIEGKLHKMLGTIPVFCLPGNPYICESCYNRTLESYSMWDMSITGITEYLEEEEPPDVPKSDIKELENKLQRVVKKFCMEKLSRLDEDVTIMGNVYVSLGERAMVKFPIDSTAEIEINNDDDDDDNNNAQEEPEIHEDPADTSFRSEDLGGILDANMGDIDINFDDIEVDVEYFGSSSASKSDSLAVDLEALLIKNEPEDRDTADNDIELEVETVKKDVLNAKAQPNKSPEKDGKNVKDTKVKEENKKKEPSVTVNISYKDIQKAEEALIKGNTAEGRCPACKILFFPGEYIRHTDTSERKKCEYCVFQTSLICVLRKHEKKNHKNLANNKTFNTVNNAAKALFKCDKCSKCFVTHFLLNKHRIFFHGSKLIYPEYVKGRADDEMSLGSSDDEKSEEEFVDNDPDYKPSFFDDDDYVPKAKAKKKQGTTVQKKERTTVQGPVVPKKPKKERPLVQGAYSGTGGGGSKKRSVVWHYYELTNNLVDDRQTARCLMCGREVTRKQSSTWAMMAHLKTFHKDIDLTSNDNARHTNNGLVNGDEQDNKVSSSISSAARDTQFIVGSYGEIQLATPEVINSLKEKGITITRFEENKPKSGRLSPTSATVASITETDEAVSSLLSQSVQISNVEGVNISMSELLDGKTQVSSTDAEPKEKHYKTQYAKDKKTGSLLEVRIPQKSMDSVKTQEPVKDNVSTGT